MAHSRSQFLKGALRFGAASTVAPMLIMDGALAERALAAGARDSSKNILVVVQLAGGNDGLNSVVPYADGLYYQARPTLAIPPSRVLHLDNRIGLHPNLKGIKGLYDQGKVAVIQGVGYPDPNLSHFRSTDIWQSAQPVGNSETGWLGRFLDSAMAGEDNPLKAVSIGPLLPKAFWAAHTLVPAVEDLTSFRYSTSQWLPQESKRVLGAFQQLAGSTDAAEGPYLSLLQMAEASSYQATIDLAATAGAATRRVPYPQSDLAKALKLVSRIIASNLGTRVFMVTQSGYDDHAQEAQAHPRLMQDLGDAVAAFYQDLSAQGRADRVLMMTFSEFGRRPLENASNGTDHGTAAPLLVVGDVVKGGLYGEMPSLAHLDDGNLRFTTDFRSVYTTVLTRWLGADAGAAVPGAFPTIPFV